MSDTIKARFVGGPKHNELLTCNRLSYIRVAERRPLTLAYFSGPPEIVEDAFRATEYRLCGFVSEGGARFEQYIHESLIHNGTPDRCTYAEPELPAMPGECFSFFAMRLVLACGRNQA